MVIDTACSQRRFDRLLFKYGSLPMSTIAIIDTSNKEESARKAIPSRTDSSYIACL